MATHAEQMVTLLRAAELNSAGRSGAISVTVDGMSVTYESQASLRAALRDYERDVARENGSRPRAATIDLSSS